MGYEQIIPRPAGEIKPYKSPDKHWEEVTKEMYGSADLPQTIHFQHDPEWDSRLWSVQNARNQYEFKSFGFWSLVGTLMAAGWLTLVVHPFSWRYRYR